MFRLLKKSSNVVLFLVILGCSNDKEYSPIYEEYNGVIVGINKDYNNHAVYKFDVVSRNKEHVRYIYYYPNSWEYASIGDSIIKKRGDTFITIKKKNGSFQEFEYER